MRVALLSAAPTRKGAAVAAALTAAGVRPGLMVLEERRQSPTRRLADRLRPGPTGPETAAGWAAAHGVPTLAGVFADPAFLDRLRAWGPDLCVAAGAGILRKALLAVPRLGTVNAHMGVLPRYRGMNVAEWAALEGGPLGATVHLVDPGIDTGAILAVRQLETVPPTVAALREAVDALQLRLLAEVVARTAREGALPPATPQRKADGRQYFRMRPELRLVAERRLAARAAP